MSTDQNGNFRVGEYFKIDQATGTATLNANAFNLAGLTSLRLGSIGAQLGESINEFSSDATLAGNSNIAVPTEAAVKTYVDTALTTRVPQAIPTAVGVDNKYLYSNGSGVEWRALDGIIGSDNIEARSTFKYDFTYSVFSPDFALPTAWSLSGTIPSGTSIDASTGVLTVGSTTPVGIYSISVVANSTNNITLTKSISVTVSTAVPIFGTQNLPGAVNPSTSFSSTVTQATAGSGTTVHTLSAGALPTWLTLSSSGVLSGTSPGSPIGFDGPYSFTVTATNGTFVVKKSFSAWNFYLGLLQGQNQYTSPGTYSWTAPSAVTSVSAVAIGAGGAGQDQWANPGGGGGGLGWKNNIPVTPGNTYTVYVGAGGTSTPSSGATQLLGGTSFFINKETVAGYGGGNQSGAGSYSDGPNKNGPSGGGYVGDGGGAGGQAQSYQGGGGAGGYYGRGGNNQETWNYPSVRGAYGGSYYSSTYGSGSGGGIGLLGDIYNSTTGWPSPGNAFYNPFTGYNNSTSYGSGGSGAFGGGNGYYGENPFSGSGQSSDNQQGANYGGGGGGPGTSWPNASGNGGSGGVRIIWGVGRAYPGTNTADVSVVGP